MNFDSLHSDSFSSGPKKKFGRKKGSKNFELWQKDYLLNWLQRNGQNLYPPERVKLQLAKEINSTKRKVANWFINMRKVRCISAKFFKILFLSLLFCCETFGITLSNSIDLSAEISINYTFFEGTSLIRFRHLFV
jgi:hypothetical protein